MNIQQFERIFKPRSVAVVGASKNPLKMGTLFFSSLIESGFPKVYPINPTAQEILGVKAYPSVKDVPDVVDYVIISVPAENVPSILKDCVEKGVNAVAIYTGGFSEIGEIGKEKEKELLAITEGKVRIIGPNCIGAFCIESNLKIFPLPFERGNVSFVCQSGGNVAIVANLAKKIGVGMSKIVSYGNASDLDSTDFIEYFGEDPDTKIIIAYIEGVKDGKRFLKVAKDVGSRKPIIVFRGGTTKGGSKAVASHTGSLSGSNEIWNAVFKQTGAIPVSSIEELLWTALAFTRISELKSNNVALLGIGGGASVMGVDECERSGLRIYNISDETRKDLEKIIPNVGTNLKNPIDLSDYAIFNPSLYKEALKILLKDPNIDAIIMLHHNMYYYPGQLQNIEEEVSSLDKITKPAVVVLEPFEDVQWTKEKYKRLGLPVYNSLTFATRALYNVFKYYNKDK